MAHWLGHKYRCRIKPLMRKWFRAPEPGKAKTWLVYSRNERGEAIGKDLQRLVSSPKAQFRWRNPVATWQGFVYVAFVIDVFARRIVGWRASRTANAGFVLDALEQAIHQRRPAQDKLVHHSDRGSQYLSIKYTERLAEAKIAPSVGSVGDSYDNAMVETINGLFKAEVIHRRGPWRSFEAVEYATLEWVDWFNNRRLLEPIGNIPPAEAEANFYAALERSDVAA
jgi:putative transposase